MTAFSITRPSPPELIPLGFDPGEFEAIDILGAVIPASSVNNVRNREVNIQNAMPPVIVEDDGSFRTANIVNHTSGVPIQFDAFIGDSVLGFNAGPGGLGGDADYYALEELEAGQWVSAHVTAGPNILALYDEFGGVIESTEGNAGIDNYIFHEIEEPGDYYFAVVPYSFDPATFRLPSNPISGPGTALGGLEHPYSITIGVDAVDNDFYAFDLMPGDILGVNGIGSMEVLGLRDSHGDLIMQASDDASGIFPLASPLPGGGTSSIAYVIDTPGRYLLSVNGYTDGNYKLETRLFRPVLETAPPGTEQILFLDFGRCDRQFRTMVRRRPARFCQLRPA